MGNQLYLYNSVNKILINNKKGVNKIDIKKILLVALTAVAVIASVTVVSAELFDGLFGEEQKDNVNKLENITFNTTNKNN